MKICVCQFSNKQWKNLSKISCLINKTYCNLNNYEYIYHEAEIENNLKFIFLQKLKQINQILNTILCDYLVYIDIDAVFANPNKKIESLLDNQHYFFMSRDGAVFTYKDCMSKINYFISNMVIDNKLIEIKDIASFAFNQYRIDIFGLLSTIFNNPYGLNAGFYILKNTDLTKQLLLDCIHYYKVFDRYFYDQNCIASFLQREEYSKYLKILDFNTQGNGNPYNQNKEMIFDKNKHFILHCAGAPYEYKIKYITQIKNLIYKDLIKEE